MWLGRKNNSEFSVEAIYFVSASISLIFELFFCQFQFQRLLNYLENILFAIILIIPLYFFSNKRIWNFYFVVAFLFFNITLFVETSYYYVFDVNISPSSLYILLETNNIEAKEFLSFYLDKFIIVFALILLLIFLVSLSISDKQLTSINKKYYKNVQLAFSFVILLFIFKTSPLRHQNLPYLISKSFYVVYYESNIRDIGAYQSKEGIFNGTKNKNRSNKTHVVIIGESTTKNNMYLYGYHRKTNPLLCNKIQELNVFTDVISPHAGTTASIGKSLSLQNHESSSKSLEGSIIQLLNAANYETYWISNQEPVGFAETDITKVVYASQNKFYLNTKNSEESTSHDEIVIEKIDEVLDASKNNKVLFVHLLGTHFYYKNRYPESFNVFKNSPPNQFISDEKDYSIVNEYDNAVLYNDFVINKIINKIKERNTESFVLYFSDHGEEVFHTKKFAGHNDDVGTLPMFEIPFFLWQSKSFKAKNNIQIELDRPYMIDDLFHSIADLCDIKSEFVNEERSIFNESFRKRKRIILKSKDYDSLYFYSTKQLKK